MIDEIVKLLQLLSGDDKTLKYLYQMILKENSRFQISLMDKNSFPAKNGLLFKNHFVYFKLLMDSYVICLYVIRKKI